MTIVMTFLVIYLLIVIINPVTTFFHELGHALPMLAFSKEGKVEMFIGSHGDYDKSLKLRFGRLHCYIRLTQLLLMKPSGICRGSRAENSYAQQLTILYGGAVFSLSLAIVSLIAVLNYEHIPAIRLIGFTVLLFAVIDLVMNLLPRTIKDKKGHRFYNDGYMILFTIRTRRFHENITTAFRHYSAENYRDAAYELNYIVQQGFCNEILLRALCSALLLNRQHDEAAQCLQTLGKISSFDATDHFHAGYLASRGNDPETAMKHYRLALDADPENAVVLNNLGYELAEKGEYMEASVHLEKAIDLAPELAFAYDNRGYAHLMQGELEEGKRLIERSLELDPTNAYAYRNMGLYYMQIQHYGAAIALFNKAIQLDATTPRAKAYLEQAWMTAASRQHLQ
ncbi:tetratricopeptide repeat protein [Chitinophaga horti]|uniref:Tetratricopeptide repeat protein n=1 Tax=Chitinophaga horti TaxID=2920382 RepID=A0ABY6J9S1_9BACT|nr:tetratricopeptide repeat protein [Chitinophaga horti]UYQ95054.1 tetratricopeptide repeat protein [Chitinophaga horti]